jgi:hypothetical protein
MLENISYILFFGVLVILIAYIYIRLKFGFWYFQPVFHIYDVGYMLKTPGIINEYLPEKNKYTNFKNIETIVFSQLTPLQVHRFINLIRKNYLQNKDNIFSPQSENIIPYFRGHNSHCFWSFYYQPEILIDNKNNRTIEENTIIGIITSRPLHVEINGRKDAKFDVYYVDYLCVNKNWRRKNIAPQLIQTHEYNQSYQNKKISVSLFKREEELTGIIPLTVYKTYCFNIGKWGVLLGIITIISSG